MALVSLSTAKSHLGLEAVTDRDGDIAIKAEQASQLVLGRCGSTEYWRAITVTWSSATVPASVQAAVLLVLADLMDNRGDAEKPDVWPHVERLICMYKDPVLA